MATVCDLAFCDLAFISFLVAGDRGSCGLVLKRTGCSNAIAVHAKLQSAVVTTIANKFEKGKVPSS